MAGRYVYGTRESPIPIQSRVGSPATGINRKDGAAPDATHPDPDRETKESLNVHEDLVTSVQGFRGSMGLCEPLPPPYNVAIK